MSSGSIKLRRRRMPSGRESLYLDTYVNGNRMYEYLHLYLVEERTGADRRANKETLALAEEILSIRQRELREGLFGLAPKKRGDKGGVSLLGYMGALASRKGASTASSWQAGIAALRKYGRASEKVQLGEISPEWIKDWMRGMDTSGLAESSRWVYLAHLGTALNAALRDGLIKENPMQKVRGYQHPEPRRVYLSVEEIRAMAAVPCRRPVIGRAFLFSCLTGLRKSDIAALRWGMVSEEGGFTRITFRQVKTGKLEYLDISPQAVPYMGERGREDEFVFRKFPFGAAYISQVLTEWAESAGVRKRVTFHVARHSFAVMMLSAGAGIYTVSKLLGHRDVATTQVYADLVDKSKQEAVLLLPNILDEG